MPTPRPISTSNRKDALDGVDTVFEKQAFKLDAIIADLSKPHVDDKATAKTLLARAKKMRKSLPVARA